MNRGRVLAALALALALAGCGAPGLVVIRTADGAGTGWLCDREGVHLGPVEIKPGQVVTVAHVVGEHETVRLGTSHGWVVGRVTRVGLGWAVVLPLEGDVWTFGGYLWGGDSGSPAFGSDGRYVGSVEAIDRGWWWQ